MRLILMRHADAGEADPSRWPDDARRPLSQQGRVEHRAVVLALRARGVELSGVLTSPLLRACQTAEIVAEVFDGRIRPEVVEALDYRFPVRAAAAEIAGRGPEGTLLCVGHEPQLSALAALLARSAAAVPPLLNKSGTLALDFPAEALPGAGTLAWHLEPALLLSRPASG